MRGKARDKRRFPFGKHDKHNTMYLPNPSQGPLIPILQCLGPNIVAVKSSEFDMSILEMNPMIRCCFGLSSVDDLNGPFDSPAVILT